MYTQTEKEERPQGARGDATSRSHAKHHTWQGARGSALGMGCLALELCRRDPSTSLPLPCLLEGGRERPVSLEDLNITTTTTALGKPQCHPL